MYGLFVKFWHFQIVVSLLLLSLFKPNVGVWWISVCSVRLCGLIVANPIIYRLVSSPSRYEIKQWAKKFPNFFKPVFLLMSNHIRGRTFPTQVSPVSHSGLHSLKCRMIGKMAIATALRGFNDHWTFGDPYISFQKQILFALIYTLSKNEQNLSVGS